VVLASDPNLTIAMTDCTAYSNGFEFCITLRSRANLDARTLGFGPHPTSSGKDESDGLFLIKIRFADGRSASSGERGPGRELMDYYLAKRDGLEPELPKGPVLMPPSGGGGGKRYDFKYWVWPLPPEGNVTVTCEWPARGLQLTDVELDGNAILRAGALSTDLWRSSDRGGT
jgi:hypothetical protein